MGSFTRTEMKVLKSWEDWGIDMCQGYTGVMNDTEMSKQELKPIIENLKRRGILEFYRGLMNDDGGVAGAGWSITIEGRDKYYEQLETELELEQPRKES